MGKAKVYPVSSWTDGLHLVSVNRWVILHVFLPKYPRKWNTLSTHKHLVDSILQNFYIVMYKDHLASSFWSSQKVSVYFYLSWTLWMCLRHTATPKIVILKKGKAQPTWTLILDEVISWKSLPTISGEAQQSITDWCLTPQALPNTCPLFHSCLWNLTCGWQCILNYQLSQNPSW